MLISVLTLVILGIAFWKRDRKSESLLKAAGKKQKVPVSVGETGLTLEALFRKLIRRVGGGKEKEKTKFLKTEAEVLAEKANLLGAAYLLALLGAAAGLVIGIVSRDSAAVTEIVRPEFGEEKTVELVVDREGETKEILFPVSGRVPTEEEIDAVFDQAFSEGKLVWLGENESYECVRTKLAFSGEDDKGIRYAFESDAQDRITNYGTILAEDIPKEGEEVRFRVTLYYDTYEKAYELTVRLLPEEGMQVSPLEEALSAANREGSTEQSVKLPTELDGAKLTFWKKEISPGTVLALFLLIAGIVAFLPESREQAELKKRKEALERGYSQMVSGLCTYISAGLSIRMAWLRIADLYRAEVKAGIRPKEYVYEEMVLSANELFTGVPEEEVYVKFGRRLGSHRYLKLGNLLSQSIRQGIAGLENALRSETEEALEERKNTALKKGEEAGTKLLAPMMIMLGIVIVILVIPAFMMF